MPRVSLLLSLVLFSPLSAPAADERPQPRAGCDRPLLKQAEENAPLPVRLMVRRAADRGFVVLAQMFLDGKVVERNEARAVGLLRLAAEQGLPEGQYLFAVLCYNGKGVARKDTREAARWFRRAAEQGHRQAQLMYALMLLNGEGVTKDVASGVRWVRKAADAGHADSQFWMGRLHEQGLCVDRSPAEAARWYRKAAAQGNKLARMRLTLIDSDL